MVGLRCLLQKLHIHCLCHFLVCFLLLVCIAILLWWYLTLSRHCQKHHVKQTGFQSSINVPVLTHMESLMAQWYKWFQGQEFKPCEGQCVVSLSKALYLTCSARPMCIGRHQLRPENIRHVVQRTSTDHGDPLTVAFYIEKSGPIARKKEMDTSGCTEKFPTQFSHFTVYSCTGLQRWKLTWWMPWWKSSSKLMM